jgi:N-acetylmuramoyl-L-alanine amidase
VIAAAGLLLLLAGGPGSGPAIAQPLPDQVTIATPRGELQLPVRLDDTGAPVLYASPLVLALGGEVRLSGAWANVVIAKRPLKLLVGASFYVLDNRVHPMAGEVSLLRDTLFVPLDFVTAVLPAVYPGRFTWDPAAYRLAEAGWKPAPAPVAAQPSDTRDVAMTGVPGTGTYTGPRLPNGLRPGHVVTVDAGHGGDDNGNPGLYLPGGLKEKHVTLAVALLLRRELESRGVRVRMTRTTDVRPDLVRRAPTCGADCDLFVSLHVDALDTRRNRNYQSVNGFHTIIIGEENTEESNRIARMENEALRFEDPDAVTGGSGGLGFILKDLQMNEYLRESARAGELIQDHLGEVHPGRDLGVRQSNILAVLNTARRPAVLVEMGFSTHRTDAQFLGSSSGQRRIASSVADAIVRYLLEFERRTGESAGDGTR